MGVEAGSTIRGERTRRRWSLTTLADRAGISTSHLAEVEAGAPASLETYARLMTALDLEPRLEGLEPARRRTSRGRDEDFVHASMGEAQARRLQRLDFEVAIDEPFQHYQFAGRADVVAWDRAARALLHIENRTGFRNVQEALGSYGTKRAYLGRVLAERLGITGGWASESHVIAALWSSEVIHVLRLREATFRAACADTLDAFRSWWAGDIATLLKTSSSLVVFDPAPSVRDAFRVAELSDATRPRYRDYADAADELRRT